MVAQELDEVRAAGLVERIEALTEALRQELFQYGEVLTLLDQQKQWLTSYASEAVWGSMLRLQRERAKLEGVLSQRQNAWLELARALGLPEAVAADALMARLPEKYRLTAEALWQENAHLLTRVRHCARQNQVLLDHVLQSLRQFLEALDHQSPNPPIMTKEE